MDFVFGFPKDAHGNNGILVFVDRFSKMVHLVAVPESITAEGCARVFIDTIFRLHGLPRELVSDRDPRFTAEFWRSTERANRVLEEILRRYVHSFTSWSEFLSMVEFAINNSVHASTTHTPFYVNGLRHPRVPTLVEDDSNLRGGTRSSENQSGSSSSRDDVMVDAKVTEIVPFDFGEEEESKSDDALTDNDADDISIVRGITSENSNVLAKLVTDISAVHSQCTAAKSNESAEDFLLTREAVVRFVQDSIAEAVDKQKRNADNNRKANAQTFIEGDLVLLSTVNLPKHVVTNVGSNKLLPRYIDPLRVLRRLGNAYTIEFPRRMRTHHTFYVGRLRPYVQYAASSNGEDSHYSQESPSDSCCQEPDLIPGRVEMRSSHDIGRSSDELSPARYLKNEVAVHPPLVRQHCFPETSHGQTQAVAQCPLSGDASPVSGQHHNVAHELHGQTRLTQQTSPMKESDRVFPPPPHPLVDFHGGKHFLVERLLYYREVKGRRTSYLVRWRGYPPSADSWEPRAQLMADVPGLVEQYDKGHPMVKDHRKTSAQRARKGDCKVAIPSRISEEIRALHQGSVRRYASLGTLDEVLRHPGHGSPQKRHNRPASLDNRCKR
ncbi:unnamed protein product [Peronospora farinosa]|nr:unnamed protein product [Peronospora farinosa]